MTWSQVVVRIERDQQGLQSSEPISIPVSFDLRDVLKTLLRDLPGIADLRLLIREDGNPKLFVITSNRDLDRDFAVVKRMIQIEDIKPGSELNYDIIPEAVAHFVPDDAVSI